MNFRVTLIILAIHLVTSLLAPIEVQTCSAPQNDRQNLVFVKDIKVVVKNMTRNRRKVIGKPGDSLLCRLHSIQLSALVYSFLYAESTK